MPPTVPVAPGYTGIQEAPVDTRFPFLQQQGRYLVKTIGWRNFLTQKKKNADCWEVEIVKTYRGVPQPGEKYARMRTEDAYGTWLSEVKARAVTLLTVKGGPGTKVDPASVNGALMTSIVNANGKPFYGYLMVVEVMPEIKTKAGMPFTPINHFVPTAADLEGVDLVNASVPPAERAASTPAAPPPIVHDDVEQDDFATALSYGWSETELNKLDDPSFGRLLDEKVQRTSVVVAADGATFAPAVAQRRSRTGSVGAGA